MNSNPEQRDKTRFPHETPITLENFEIGLLHGARMLNFSAEGMYFESDYVLERGTELFIGIKNSPYAPDPDVYECYRAQIRWRKPLKKSSYYYGYGAKFLELEPQSPNLRKGRNLRRHPRKSCIRTAPSAGRLPKSCWRSTGSSPRCFRYRESPCLRTMVTQRTGPDSSSTW